VAKLVSTGDVYYSGDPPSVQQEIHGSGKLIPQ